MKGLELIKFHHLSVEVHKAQVIIMMMMMIIIIIMNKHRREYGAVL